MTNTTLIMHAKDVNHHLDLTFGVSYQLNLAFTLSSSVILAEIWHFDISNCSTPSKIGLGTRCFHLGGVRYFLSELSGAN